MDNGELNDLAWRVSGLEMVIGILVAAGGPAAIALRQRRRDLEEICGKPETAADMRRATSFELQLLRNVPL
jgi:hypothetical protein